MCLVAFASYGERHKALWRDTEAVSHFQETVYQVVGRSTGD
jgi:hypothetical protein